MSGPPQPPRGLSLYDNLLDPNDPSPPATISSAPVIYDQPPSSTGDSAPKKPIDPAFRFQPIRRPQAKPTKPKATFPKAVRKPGVPHTNAAATAAAAATTTATTTRIATTAPASATASLLATSNSIPQQQPSSKTTLADWAATEQDEWMYGVGEKRQRGGRRKKKKKHQEQIDTDWDELYDPTRPTNVDEYLRSDEKVDEVREWKALLYHHRKQRDESDMSDDDDDDDDEDSHPLPSNQFAPPPSYAFAPPPKSPPAAPSRDETADDAYARRLALSGQDPRSPSPSSSPPPPPPPPTSPPPPPQLHPAAPPARSPPRITAPPPPPPPSDPATISRAPIRYIQPEAPPQDTSHEDDDDEAYSPPPTLGASGDDNHNHNHNHNDSQPAPRSTRPGQAGFAHRLMSKYGWTKGTALGANESGILNPLRVQVEKRRKKADAEGGGWAEPAGKGKIVGGRRKEEAGSFGAMSDVIVLQNMLENMPDLQAEIADGLGQEIGEECGEKYGRVERLYIDQETRRVFIKFTDQVSALRAVNELDGRVFNGNKIAPRFYDSEDFEKGNHGN